MHGRRVRRIRDGSYWNGPHGQAGGEAAGAERPYRLPPHVYVCSSGRHTVFLDLRADRYFAVETEAAAPVLRRTEGWDPAAARAEFMREPGTARTPPQEPFPEGLARSLLAQGLLTADRDGGKPMRPPWIEAPRDDLVDVGLIDPPPLGCRDVVRFVIATVVASIAFRCLPLHRLVRRVSRRRMRIGRRASPTDPALARRCVAAYERLRPLVFTARDACLFESFVLIELAARYGLYPAWVFGIQTTPFAAHCWVQQGSLLLNDSAEHAAGYSPILAA